MVNTIYIKRIANGYTSESSWTDPPGTTVYHKNLDETFKHLTQVFGNDKKFTSEIKYTDK